MDDLHENLKLQAQCHAQEARTANSTINEIYQLCTGATGEPGTWHGAEPVRRAIQREREAAVREFIEKSVIGMGTCERSAFREMYNKEID